ncbi:hypothetical protein BGT96224_Ac30857 [Blumeria graminis f. sp. tritici 96224]|nr:hypothetical protein BGT96224_Ac30857 [Blumeria graminis f. sp. tritici 96224]
MDEIRKEIARIQRENIELKSPNNSIKSLATRLRYPFLIPISVGYEFNQKGHGNYVTNDGNRNLNYWVVVDSDGKEVSCCSSSSANTKEKKLGWILNFAPVEDIIAL